MRIRRSTTRWPRRVLLPRKADIEIGDTVCRKDVASARAMTQIFIVSGTSWTVPGDWSNSNTIETIGGGGGGGTANSVGSGTGGGGGGYSKITNLSGLSGSITLSVGSGGSSGAAGGDTWFNGASIGASSVGAKGGGGRRCRPR